MCGSSERKFVVKLFMGRNQNWDQDQKQLVPPSPSNIPYFVLKEQMEF